MHLIVFLFEIFLLEIYLKKSLLSIFSKNIMDDFF